MRHKIFAAVIIFLIAFHLNPYTYGHNYSTVPTQALPQSVSVEGQRSISVASTGISAPYMQIDIAAMDIVLPLQDSEPGFSAENTPQESNYNDLLHDFDIKIDLSDEILEAYPTDIIRQIDSDKPMIALTFDDGPGQNTERILDILENYNVQVTFCVIGSRIAANENIVRRTFELGHEIVGHSWSHPLFTNVSRAEVTRQIVDTNEEIYRITGERPALHRPPYGAINYAVKSVSRELDMVILGWSVDPRDWEQGATADGIFEHIMSHVFDGAVIILHDIHEVTAEAIEKVIPELIKQGYQMVTVSELISHSGNQTESGEIFRRR